ncbi:MAG: NAD(P)-dependent oxidoreductase [Deltaproteobacteria bacterium]|nr:NAD(P)-dependent oxidoreductase [Deltaproteobacteria bacterium]
MKVAVTGAAGFVGRHVLGALASQDVEVVAVDIRGPEDPAQVSGVRYIKMDIAGADTEAFKTMGTPDVLIHLAWKGLPNYKSLHHFETELPAQYRFLRSMIEGGLKSLLVTGTCYEYGMQSGQLSEDTETRPSNPYAFAKDALRKQLEYLQSTRAFNLTWARLFFMYGAGQSPNSLLPQLKNAVEQGEKVFNMSGGEQLRDYLPIEEVARRIVFLALKQQGLGVVNVCSGQPVSVRKLVEGWVTQNSWNINLNYGHYPYPDYEPMAFWGDTAKYRAVEVNK